MTILYLKLFAKIVKWVNLTAVIIFVSLWFLDAKPNGRPTKYDMSEKKKQATELADMTITFTVLFLYLYLSNLNSITSERRLERTQAWECKGLLVVVFKGLR